MNDAEKNKNTVKYTGNSADVLWDERLCIHVGECGRAKGDLFVGGRKPWCQPDLVSVEDVVDVVQRCPTGALTVARKDGGPSEQPPAKNTVTVANNGPLYFTGDLHIEGAPADMEGVRFRAALCRCGQSKNKPFCDNAHETANFRDHGAVGEVGDGSTDDGGPIEVRRAKNGPLLLSGNFSILSGNGRVAWQGAKAALCRCGESKNKPFCDGAHKSAGFVAE
ncbi:MAG: CDGSH iron-sulfur domain-containing protein [Myxococcota bacterium]